MALEEFGTIIFKLDEETEWRPLLNFTISTEIRDKLLPILTEMVGPDYSLAWEKNYTLGREEVNKLQ